MNLKAVGKGLGGVFLGLLGAGAGAVTAVLGIKCCTQSADDIFDSLFSKNEDEMDIDIDIDIVSEEDE